RRIDYAAPNDNAYIVGLPCRMHNYDGSTLVSEEWMYYDGLATKCASPTRGALTRHDRAVSAGRNIREGFTYTTQGQLKTHSDPRGTRTTYSYDATWPWLRTESTVTASGSGAVLSHAWTYHGVGASSGSGWFGLLAS